MNYDNPPLSDLVILFAYNCYFYRKAIEMVQ